MIIGLFPANKSLNINAQDDIYYAPSKNQVTDNAINQDKVAKDNQDLTDYEKYRAMRDADVKQDIDNSKPDSALSPEELAKKKGMEQYGQGNNANDEQDNQSYSQQNVDSSSQGTTIINNYYDDYPNRYGWYNNLYFDYYWDPFFYSFYDPFFWGWGFAWGWPSWGFGFYGYDPYFYGYGYGYWGHYYGYRNGYYGGYANNDHGRGYTSGGARRTMGGYLTPSDVRRTSLNVGNNLNSNLSRRTSNVTPSDENGGTYKSARRDAYPLYQKTSATSAVNNNVSTVRRETPNKAYDRYKNVQTTRPGTSNYRRDNIVNNSQTYSPSYNTQKSSTKSQYNSYSSNYSRRNTSYSTKSATTASYSYPNSSYTPRRSYQSSSSSYSSGRRSSYSGGGSTYTPSRSSSSSGSSYSGSSENYRSSGGGGSSSGGSHGGGGGHRR